MGKIKKILENELVGGTQPTDVYPVFAVILGNVTVHDVPCVAPL